MSREQITRRRFLTVPLAALFAPVASVCAETHPRREAYSAEVGLLYDLITLRADGTIYESVDSSARTYDISVIGTGTNVANRIESRGRLIDGRWAPVKTAAWFQVRGRQARSEINYDYVTKKIKYQFRGETFFLRRVRMVDDVINIPPDIQVDDALSAILNYSENRWEASANGQLSTYFVRRRRKDDEGVDDVEPNARAELIQFHLAVHPDPATRKLTAYFDMRPFSSWAVDRNPARIVFTADRRPELITSSLILGTSVTIRLRKT